MRVDHWRQVRRLAAGDIRFGVGRRTPQRESSLGFVSGAHAAKVLSMNSHATKNAFFMSSTKLPSGPPLHPTTSTTGPSQLPLPRPLPPAPPTSTPATNSTQSCYLTRPSLATQLRCYSPPRLATSQPSLATSPPSLATQLRGSSPRLTTQPCYLTTQPCYLTTQPCYPAEGLLTAQPCYLTTQT